MLPRCVTQDMLKEEGNGHSFMIFATNQMKGVLMLVLKVFLIAMAILS